MNTPTDHVTALLKSALTASDELDTLLKTAVEEGSSREPELRARRDRMRAYAEAYRNVLSAFNRAEPEPEPEQPANDLTEFSAKLREHRDYWIKQEKHFNASSIYLKAYESKIHRITVEDILLLLES